MHLQCTAQWHWAVTSLRLWPPQRRHAVRRTDTLSPYTLMPPPQHPLSMCSVNLTIPRTSSGASNNTCPSVTGSYHKVFRFHVTHVSISALFKAEWHSPVCISHILLTWVVKASFCFLSLVAVLGPCCRPGLSLVTESGGSSVVVVHGLLIMAAPLVGEHRL